MSDLSRVLGDLYADADDQGPTTTAAEARFQAKAPEWADEARLDEAFAGWTPGPPPEAHATEREMSVVIDGPALPPAQLDDDLAATLTAALVDAGRDNHDPDVPVAAAPAYALPTYDDDPLPLTMAPVETYVGPSQPAYEPEPEPVYVPEPVAPARPWSRNDDDIIPSRAVTAKAPKAPKAKAPKAPKAKAPKTPKASRLHKVKGEKAPKPEKAPKAEKVKAPKAKAPKVPKAEKPQGDAPKKFLGIELTFRRK